MAEKGFRKERQNRLTDPALCGIMPESSVVDNLTCNQTARVRFLLPAERDKTLLKYDYQIVRLSDEEYQALFDERKEFKYSFFIYTDKLETCHEIYSLQIEKKDIANMAIEFFYVNSNKNSSKKLIFITGFQRNKYDKNYKGYGALLLKWIINRFRNDYILLYTDKINLEHYYSRFGFGKCDALLRDRLISLYGFRPLTDYVLMILY